jgi:hypothetical protein
MRGGYDTVPMSPAGKLLAQSRASGENSVIGEYR